MNNTTEYIPYSKRHNVTDPDLAGLLDYLERVMGWEIQIKDFPELWGFSILNYTFDDKKAVQSGGYRLHIDEECSNTVTLTHSQKIEGGSRHERYLDQMRLDIFYRTYKTLLPAIRDLSSK